MTENINILEELRLLNSEILINVDRKNIYFLSEGFFEDFSANVTREIWINSVANKNFYTVPAGYFENLPEIILDKLLLSKDSVLKDSSYYLPGDYFDNLADNILKKIAVKRDNINTAEHDDVNAELEKLSPLLSKIPKTNVFSVPDEYFATLKPVEKNEIKEPAKVVSFGSKTRKWISYAVAACIAAVVFTGGYKFFQNKNSSLDKQQFANVNVKLAISQLSDDEIDNYLNNDNYDIYSNNNSNSDNQNLDIKSMLENTSDEEMNSYLLENSDPGEKTGGI